MKLVAKAYNSYDENVFDYLRIKIFVDREQEIDEEEEEVPPYFIAITEEP